VMGVTGSGKSSFIKLCCESEVEIGHGLQPCKFPFRKICLYNFFAEDSITKNLTSA
jgi:hypothetical protein